MRLEEYTYGAGSRTHEDSEIVFDDAPYERKYIAEKICNYWLDDEHVTLGTINIFYVDNDEDIEIEVEPIKYMEEIIDYLLEEEKYHKEWGFEQRVVYLDLQTQLEEKNLKINNKLKEINKPYIDEYKYEIS